MTKGSPRLSRLGVLAPVALSACMDASVLAVPAAGAMVSTVLKELSKAFMLKKWFHGVMTAEEAEDLIMENGKNGSFLVRESQTHPGEYVLSVRVRGKVNHVMIKKEHNKYGVGNGEYFDDLVELIMHFRSYPMVKTSGDILRLLQPVNGKKRRKPDIIPKLSNLEIADAAMEIIKGAEPDQEFSSLKLFTPSTSCALEASQPKNAIKNRYQNILPYDRNRVVLKPLKNSEATDYINASHILYSFPPGKICGGHSAIGDAALQKLFESKSYIAAQGCMANTVCDFWMMVWQQDIRVIAALGPQNENGQNKYETYWPDHIGVENRYENLVVTLLSHNSNESYIVREFQICDSCCRKRNVFQYQMTTWLDHSVPDKPCGVLKLVNDINNKLLEIAHSDDPPKRNIVCVHCSAGVGRTGTFIALDILLNEAKIFGIENTSVIDTVKAIRTQRRGMVQTKAQYKFIYEALYHYYYLISQCN